MGRPWLAHGTPLGKEGRKKKDTRGNAGPALVKRVGGGTLRRCPSTIPSLSPGFQKAPLSSAARGGLTRASIYKLVRLVW